MSNAHRLLVCGLLSKYPLKSTIVLRFVKKRRANKHWTLEEKKQVTALFWTPGLKKTWIAYQFEKHGCNPIYVMDTITKIACNPENRRRWEHLGKQNILYITQEHVMRYYQRRDPRKKLNHPHWALPFFYDHKKAGMTERQIEKMYGLTFQSIDYLIRRKSLFEPQRDKMVNNNYSQLLRKAGHDGWKNKVSRQALRNLPTEDQSVGVPSS